MEQDYDVHGRGYWHCPKLDEKKTSAAPHGPDTEQRDPSTKEKANLLSSLCKDGLHRPPEVKKPAAMLAAPMEYKTSKDLNDLRLAARAKGQCGIVLDGRRGLVCNKANSHYGSCD